MHGIYWIAKLDVQLLTVTFHIKLPKLRLCISYVTWLQSYIQRIIILLILSSNDYEQRFDMVPHTYLSS